MVKEPLDDLFGIDFAIREGRDLARLEFSFMVLAVVTLVILAFVRIARGDTGRAFLAVRANERAAASAGIDFPPVTVTPPPKLSNATPGFCTDRLNLVPAPPPPP